MSEKSFHETLRDHGPQKQGTDRGFGIVFAVVFSLIALFQLYVGRLDWAIGLGVVAAVFLALALVAPAILRPLNRIWLRFGALIHKITNPLIMGLIFFVVFAPMGMIMRVFGFNPLRQGFERDRESYWIDREVPGPSPESMKQQF